jgi:Rieske Fe-S protein
MGRSYGNCRLDDWRCGSRLLKGINVSTEEKVPDENRRKFLKLLGVLVIGAGTVGALRSVVQNIIPPVENVESSFPTLTLYFPNGNPVHTNDLTVNNPQIVVFDYPLQNEPSFLLRLGDSSNNDVEIKSVQVKIPATGKSFSSVPGVGPYNSVVGSSAICQHLGCIPPEIRFYPPSSSSFPGKIHCSCHGSIYDPYSGFSVVTGPTQSPLPNVNLVYDKTSDTYSATVMVGPTIYGHSDDLSGGQQITTAGKTVVTTIQ